VAIGQQEHFRNTCTRIRSAAGPQPSWLIANDVAWNCSLAEGAVANPAAVVALAERAVAAQPRDWGGLNTLAAALLRAGRTTDSIAKPEESVRLCPPGSDRAQSELLLAIAHSRLGQIAEARYRLNAAATMTDRTRAPAAACGTLRVGPVGDLPVAVALFAKRLDPLVGMPDYSLRTWLEIDILRAEAEEALAKVRSH
jgi:hypothetical protein